ncbi:MAG TPA: SDR family oxidoreductase [Nocardioides sp.]|uniref:SDR family oxidoreductase n=1 Tax=Nocardioides sp. TaxID=35761 RepID=UPI002C0AFE01|nr:SDR family oxidoreductase [Nocardioides sp.]HQR28475.1 SDR family oxidoreductase [Nocardioides sp.]
MALFLTGATGFIGRHLVAELLDHRDGDLLVLVRSESLPRFRTLATRWGGDRVHPVVGDLARPGLGVDPDWVAAHRGGIEHFFHVAALYDMLADDDANELANVGGTRHALELAAALGAGCFHHVSSVAVAGDHRGPYDESMFDERQRLPSSYHRTKFEAERLVRDEARVPWRIYRPSVVVGHSRTGVMDKVDGPYYFFPLIKRMRDTLPSWLPLLGADLGATNLVPVDYVAKALDHLAHLPGRDGETFHLVNPEPQPVAEVMNLFCAAAGAPRFLTPGAGRRRLGVLPVPSALRPARLLGTVAASAPGRVALDQTLGRLGVPSEVLANAQMTAVLDSRRTTRALSGSGVAVPDLESYARTLWSYWEECLDTDTGRDPHLRAGLQGRHVVVTGASSGIGRVTAIKVAQAGGVPVLVARSKDRLEEVQDLIEAAGGVAYVYPCDLSDTVAVEGLAEQLTADLPSVDVVVNNAGRSIRRSLRLSQDRFHDFERTMAVNYFGPVRLVMALMPAMHRQKSGHVVNVSTIGVQTTPPRFSAYIASKSALDAWSNVVAAEVYSHGITFTTIHMPLVRTPMIAPTALYDRFPAITPAQAADLVLRAIVDKPAQINTALGNVGAVAHTVAPKLTFRILNMAYQAFPDSTAAKGQSAPPTSGTRESEQLMLARVFRGVHW